MRWYHSLVDRWFSKKLWNEFKKRKACYYWNFLKSINQTPYHVEVGVVSFASFRRLFLVVFLTTFCSSSRCKTTITKGFQVMFLVPFWKSQFVVPIYGARLWLLVKDQGTASFSVFLVTASSPTFINGLNSIKTFSVRKIWLHPCVSVVDKCLENGARTGIWRVNETPPHWIWLIIVPE